jgi:hypothetical protein
MKTKWTRTLMAACSVVALSAVMYGCVHSGGGDKAEPPVVEPDPDPVDVDTKKVNDAIDAANAAIDGLTGMSSDADVAAAQDAIDAAQAALDGTDVLSVTTVRAMQANIDAATASLGTKQTAISDYRTHQSQLSTAQTAVDAATAAVTGLSADSSDADAADAEAAVQDAKDAVAAGTMLTADERAALNGAITLAEANLTNAKNLIADRKAMDLQNQQQASVQTAIDMAMAAVGGLTAMSSDADIDAAEAAIDAAKDALTATTVLTSTVVRDLQAQIDGASASLGMKEASITKYRTHQSQLGEANMAVTAAKAAVNGVNVDSTDAELAAAQDKIDAATAAVEAGTELSAGEKASLNGDIMAAQTSLDGVNDAIKVRNEHDQHLADAEIAVEAAKMAVDGLTAASSSEEVAAAKAAINAAQAHITAPLTPVERATLGGQIDVAEAKLERIEGDITEQQAHDRQLAAVTNLVETAEIAVAALNEMSTEAEEKAANDVIDAADVALNDEDSVLTATEAFALQSRIGKASQDLNDNKRKSAAYREHKGQLDTATGAVGDAEDAVKALTSTSTAEQVAAAQGAIDDAEAAVADGTKLTDEERETLNGEIATAKLALVAVEKRIAATTAVDAATTAVMGLNNMSTDEAVDEAMVAITAAGAAVDLLEDGAEKDALKGKVALAQVSFTNKETARNTHNTQKKNLADATTAVGSAETLVSGLDADSTDEQVKAAETAVEAAETAVSKVIAGDDKTALDRRITTAKGNLSTIKIAIAERRKLNAAQTVARLHGEASGATTDAKEAGKAAADALKDAEDYDGMLDVLDVGGDSAMATANAQKILDAQADVTQAVLDARAAKTRAQTAKTEATALADTVTGKAALIVALDAAIKEADAQIKAASDIRDGSKLKVAVETVTGTATKKLTAADKGKTVATAINAAFAASARSRGLMIEGEITNVPDITEASATQSVPVKKDDGIGMTWADIGSNLIELTVAEGTAPTRTAKAMPVADGTKVSVYYSATKEPEEDDDVPNRHEETSNITYKGITGMLVCGGSDCEVAAPASGTDAANRLLKGSWYFTTLDANAESKYVAGTTAGSYTVEAYYVRFGYWLSAADHDSDASTPDQISINRYADGPGAVTGVYGINLSSDHLNDTSASYKGDAVGMSVLRTFEGGKETGQASGSFTADVSLMMEFGTGAELSGTIDNFQGSAVNTGWSVDLSHNTTAFTGSFVDGVTNDLDNDGEQDANTNEGSWTATAYGVANRRPTGVYGSFDAEFNDGDVVGVYATRKQ